MADIILETKNLKKYFATRTGPLRAVDDVSLQIERGKTLGIVGESGCGKSTLGRAILRLHEPTSGQIIFDGQDITHIKEKEIRKLRREMQIIFQDPYASLDPRWTVYDTIAEPLIKQKLCKDKKELSERVRALMKQVGLAERLINTYPHELDGGRRQRIGIARALASTPKFIVCDEPVSALDVSIQAQILNLLEDLQEELGLTYIFITHDLSVVHHLADEIAVMYLGKMVEKAPTLELFEIRCIHILGRCSPPCQCPIFTTRRSGFCFVERLPRPKICRTIAGSVSGAIRLKRTAAGSRNLS